MIKLVILTLSAFIYSISYGDIAGHNTFYHPVEEIYADELPESIMDIELIHSVSKLPVVFRGAAKNWEAMNWTPESLEARGLEGIEDVMKSPIDSPKRTNYGLCVNLRDKRHTYLDINTPGRTSESQLREILKDVHYYEPNHYKNVVAKDWYLLENNPNLSIFGQYTYYIIAGSKGYQMPKFHNHPTVLLAEFYGERMVFLAQPFTERKLRDNELSDEMDKVIEKANNEAMDSLFNVNSNDYFPFQQVILKPGDVLYIPSGWSHKIHYLTPCLGTTQFIQLNNMNIEFELF